MLGLTQRCSVFGRRAAFLMPENGNTQTPPLQKLPYMLTLTQHSGAFGPGADASPAR